MIYVLLVSTFFTAETAEVRTLGLVATPSVPPPCPVYCTCPPVPAGHLTIDACSRDPTGDLGPLLLSHKDISTLRITNSHLSMLPIAVCKLTNLILLNLLGNNLSSLPWECLRKLESLETIDASQNNISLLRNGIFYGFKSLTNLHFRSNKIREIEADVFVNVTQMPRLKYVDLGQNYLHSLDPWPAIFLDHNRDITMQFDSNRISRFTNRPGWVYNCGHGPKKGLLDISFNNITHIMDITTGWNATDVTIFCFLFRGTTLNINNNPFNCDCRDFKMYRYLKVVYQSHYVDHLHCKSPSIFYRTKIVTIPLSGFVCHLKKDCPPGCDCVDTPFDLTMTVSCKNNSIMALPNSLPSRPKHNYRYDIFFQDNDISSIEARPYLEFVETMYLSGNHIKNLSAELFQNLPNLVHLHLDRNELRRLPDSFLTVNLSSVSDMRFRDNQWICDCHALATKRWLVQHKEVISDWRSILCDKPARLKGTNMLTLADDRFICGDPPNNEKWTIATAVGGTLAACVILIILPVTTIYVKRVWIYANFKLHPLDWDECQGENKEFDVFVSYANEDELYVGDDLIPRLQAHGFNVCFHRIHFIAGTSIFTNIENAVYKSKRTLVFLSNAFANSDFCLWEFNVALNRDLEEATHRLVVIKDTDLAIRDLDASIKTYLRRVTYVERESRSFWDNLLYTLPVEKLGTANNQNEATSILESDWSWSDVPNTYPGSGDVILTSSEEEDPPGDTLRLL